MYTSIEKLARLQIGEDLNAETLAMYHIRKLNETIEYASQSKFYNGRLHKLSSLDEIVTLPFTHPVDLVVSGYESFLSIPHSQIDRIITAGTSGSTGASKRVAFTQDEIEKNMLFFQYGLEELMTAGDKLLVFFPGTAKNGVSDLLMKAAARMGGIPEYYGAITDYDAAEQVIRQSKPDCIAGIPGHILKLAIHMEKSNPIILKSVLLSADIASDLTRSTIEQAFSCKIFDHYGMTETGYGCALECSAHNGMHLREAEMFFEIIDPETGVQQPLGKYGELVYTTYRQGMPLIRYKTGDRTRFIPEPCPCGKILRRIEPPRRMSKNQIKRANWL